MDYIVAFVQDDQLPAGQDWALLEAHDGVYCFIKESAVTPEVIADAWAGYRSLERSPLALIA